MTRAAFALALLFPMTAGAATFSTTGPILTPGTDGSDYWEQGVGSPSITYDDDNNQWVMFFETKLTTTYVSGLGGDYSDCGAVWAVGMATASSLGGTWSVVGSDPVLMPDRDTYYECRVTHPKVVKDGSNWYVFFKANQDKNPCSSSTPPWGCNAQTGVGVATLTDLGSPSPSFTSSPVLNVSGFGFPSAVKLGNTWHLWVAKLPNLFLSTRTGNPTGSFTLDPTPVMTPGSNAWAVDRVSNPGTTCIDGSRFPYQMMVGGKTLSGQTVTASGIGESASPDGEEWFLSVDPDFGWTDDSGWRGWDMHRFVGDPGCDQGFNEEYIIPFATRDSNSENEIHLAHTTALSNYQSADFSYKICDNDPISLSSSGQAIPGGPAAAGDSGLAPLGYADSGVAWQQGQGCDTAAPLIPAALLLLVPGALLVRRRRD